MHLVDRNNLSYPVYDLICYFFWGDCLVIYDEFEVNCFQLSFPLLGKELSCADIYLVLGKGMIDESLAVYHLVLRYF